MNEMVKSIIGSVVRWALTSAAAWIVAQGVITKEQSEWILAAVVTGIATLLWSLWSKYRGKLKFFVALNEVRQGATVSEVKQVIDDKTTTERVATAFGSGPGSPDSKR